MFPTVSSKWVLMGGDPECAMTSPLLRVKMVPSLLISNKAFKKTFKPFKIFPDKLTTISHVFEKVLWTQCLGSKRFLMKGESSIPLTT